MRPTLKQPQIALPFLLLFLVDALSILSFPSHAAAVVPSPIPKPASKSAPRHDPFHGLFGPPPSLGDVGTSGQMNAATARKGRMVNVPYFVQHLISKQNNNSNSKQQHNHHHHSPHSHSHHSHHNNHHDQEKHDHSLHKSEQCRQSMQIENSLCDYDAVETINREMRKQLEVLVRQKFFKFYKVNLYESCPFWTENHLCMNKDCGVAVIDESAIPEEWRSAALGAISSPKNGFNFQPFKSCQLKDQDFCQVDDEAVSEGVYVDLMQNPERFTGYSGPSAAKVWDAIYNENCFNIAKRMQLETDCEQCSLDRQANEEMLADKLKSAATAGVSMARNPLTVASSLSEPFNPLTAGTHQDEELCLEKRVFYRMISGLHASISIHICDEHFNQTSGVWGPNLECFVSRVGAHPDRLENIFFDYAILVRAVTKLSGYLKNYEFCTGHPEEDAQVKAMVDRLIETSMKSPAIFDEKAMFVGPEAQALKLQFRDHFRNITKIMDCVGCEKCRLWGKVQTSGLGTALKVLFSYNDEHLNPVNNPNLLQRTEIVALFNTFNRLSESVESITKFREMYMQQYGSNKIPTAAAAIDVDTSAISPVNSERQKQQQQRQQQQRSEPMPVLESTQTKNEVDSKNHPTFSGVKPYFTSVLESRRSFSQPAHRESITANHRSSSNGQRDSSSPYLSMSTNRSFLSRLGMYLKGTQEWMQIKGAGFRSLILEMYEHPMLLFYGEQRSARSNINMPAKNSVSSSSSVVQEGDI